MLKRLDHVNIRTPQLDVMIDWYAEMLGMTNGPRPPFAFPGAWMYVGDDAVVHLVGVDKMPEDGTDLRLEHAAFSATGFDEMIAKLEARGDRYRTLKVPGFPLVQVNIWDPDGNHLHIDFHSDEAPGVT